jgi:FMN phosphatase YigB (HAD superfamily)
MHDEELQAGRRRVLVMDLDGTVCLGAGPALAYAAQVERLAGLDGIVHRLERFLSRPNADPAFASCEDPYDVVAIAALQAGASSQTCEQAYIASRRALDRVAVHPPTGLPRFLAGLTAKRVLITNAPDAGLERLLIRLGIAGLLDDVVWSSGKPQGVRAYVAPLLEAGRAVLSVGDRWENDLEPVARLGGATAHVDTYGRAIGRASVVGRSLPELYPAIKRWDQQ